MARLSTVERVSACSPSRFSPSTGRSRGRWTAGPGWSDGGPSGRKGGRLAREPRHEGRLDNRRRQTIASVPPMFSSAMRENASQVRTPRSGPPMEGLTGGRLRRSCGGGRRRRASPRSEPGPQPERQRPSDPSLAMPRATSMLRSLPADAQLGSIAESRPEIRQWRRRQDPGPAPVGAFRPIRARRRPDSPESPAHARAQRVPA